MNLKYDKKPSKIIKNYLNEKFKEFFKTFLTKYQNL